MIKMEFSIEALIDSVVEPVLPPEAAEIVVHLLAGLRSVAFSPL